MWCGVVGEFVLTRGKKRYLSYRSAGSDDDGGAPRLFGNGATAHAAIYTIRPPRSAIARQHYLSLSLSLSYSYHSLRISPPRFSTVPTAFNPTLHVANTHPGSTNLANAHLASSPTPHLSIQPPRSPHGHPKTPHNLPRPRHLPRPPRRLHPRNTHPAPPSLLFEPLLPHLPRDDQRRRPRHILDAVLALQQRRPGGSFPAGGRPEI